MIADDLFAGAGGWDLAAAELGIHARGVENMAEARATRDAAGMSTIHDDVWTYEPDGNAQGLIASPPCQTFSAAGKGAGRKALDDVLRLVRSNDIYRMPKLREAAVETEDARTALVLTPLHFALTNPAYRWLAWEQVPTVLPVWEACAERLRAHGWSAWTGYLLSEQYGVPQTRKRAFLLASRDFDVTPPAPTHSRYYSRTPEKLDPGVAKWVSMAEALGGGIRRADQPSATVTSKVDRNVVRPALVSAGITGAGAPRFLDEPAATITGKGTAYWLDDAGDYSGPATGWALRASNQANSAVRGIDQPAPTMLFGHASNDVRWYPEDEARPGEAMAAGERSPRSRRVSVREAGVLQSFPADHPWQGNQSKQYLQAGNAVPPGMALAALTAATGAQSRATIEGISA